MLIDLIEYLRQWDTHCLRCVQCRDYQNKTVAAPCGIGQAILLNLLLTLEKGL